MYAAAQQVNTVRHIARSAQQQIKEKTGMRIILLLYPADGGVRTPQQMLDVIALALGMSPDCYRMKTRTRNIVELRFIGALFLRQNFPLITLHEIAALFGGQDHTSILNGLMRANNMIYIGDERFLEKYTAALSSVNLWLKKES